MLPRLAALPFSAFATFVADVLKAAGYENVQARGRNRFLGNNQNGGVDLTATLFGSLGIRPVIAQLKQLSPDATVAQRYVDELRGVCLRTGAAEALLVTTGSVSPLARENAARTAHSPVAPVRVLDGEALVHQAVRHGVGITTGREGRQIVNTNYFDALEQRFMGTEVRKRVAPTKAMPFPVQPPAIPPGRPVPTMIRRMAGPVTVTVVVREEETEASR